MHYPLSSICIIDNALRDPGALRKRALASVYADIAIPGDALYKRVSLQPIPELIDAVATGGRCDPVGTAFRLNYAEELPNNWVHADIGYGRLAAVLYLSLPEHCRGGTAFWRHRATHRETLPQAAGPARAALIADGTIAGAWEQTRLIPMVFNRLILYSSALFHSRWPWPAFGAGPEDGRLIAVGFFN